MEGIVGTLEEFMDLTFPQLILFSERYIEIKREVIQWQTTPKNLD